MNPVGFTDQGCTSPKPDLGAVPASIPAATKAIELANREIEVNRRAGYDFDIKVPIATVLPMSLTEENWGDLIDKINTSTLHQPYPCRSSARMIAGIMVYRPNHNGTHGARSVAYFDALFNLFKEQGTRQAKEDIESLTADELLNLRLATYLMRAGRVDETSHQNARPDDYYTRSALIYEAYARQLSVDPEIIEWVSMLLRDSCKPLEICHEKTRSDSRSLMMYQLMLLAHETDLIRCYSSYRFDEINKPHITEIIAEFCGERKAEENTEKLLAYAKSVCTATGCFRRYDGDRGNSELFAQSSARGKWCWENVNQIAKPDWS